MQKYAYDKVIVSNPQGSEFGIKERLNKSNNPLLLIEALENPSITIELVKFIYDRLQFLSIMGYATPAVAETISAMIEDKIDEFYTRGR